MYQKFQTPVPNEPLIIKLIRKSEYVVLLNRFSTEEWAVLGDLCLLRIMQDTDPERRTLFLPAYITFFIDMKEAKLAFSKNPITSIVKEFSNSEFMTVMYEMSHTKMDDVLEEAVLAINALFADFPADPNSQQIEKVQRETAEVNAKLQEKMKLVVRNVNPTHLNAALREKLDASLQRNEKK